MRRQRLALIIGIVVAVLFGAYSVVWWVVAGRIRDGAAAWAATAQAQGIAASWGAIRVAGYPLAFRIELTDARVADTAVSPPVQLDAPALSATVRPWNVHGAAFTAPGGLTVKSPAVATLTAGSANGTATISSDGAPNIQLALGDVGVDFAALPEIKASAETAKFSVTVPAAPARDHAASALAVAGELTHLSVPLAPPPLGKAIDDLAFGMTVMGAIPPGPPRAAAAAWRDAGGTVEIDHFHIGWGALDIDARGTAALDRDLQPIGSFSGSLSGYDELLSALTATGQVRQSDARTLRLALGFLAKPGPDGKKQLSTAFSLQNGQIFVGPASLGRVPRIEW